MRDPHDMRDLMLDASARALRYLDELDERPVAPRPEAVARLAELDIALPEAGADPAATLAELDRHAGATMAMSGPRFYGFVIGGTLPAALAANWLAGAWDQNAGLALVSPLTAHLEAVALRWLVELLDLPAGTGAGFVTGATTANFSCLLAARHAVLEAVGWHVEADGLFGAPPVTVVVGEEAHTTLFKSLGLAGFGRNRVVRVPVDDQGRMRADAFPELSGPTIVCLQAGNVNSGAFDPATEIIPRAKAAGAWVHVDGAFGLWAAASPRHAHLLAGYADADSWATDAHKYACFLQRPLPKPNMIEHAAAASRRTRTPVAQGRRALSWATTAHPVLCLYAWQPMKEAHSAEDLYVRTRLVHATLSNGGLTPVSVGSFRPHAQRWRERQRQGVAPSTSRSRTKRMQDGRFACPVT
jgi:Pyridoxal-dependent decarboxylase conserved domain